jgi:hypothetical protein
MNDKTCCELIAEKCNLDLEKDCMRIYKILFASLNLLIIESMINDFNYYPDSEFLKSLLRVLNENNSKEKD